MVATATGTTPPRTWRFAAPPLRARAPSRADAPSSGCCCSRAGSRRPSTRSPSLGQDGRLPLHVWGFLGIILGALHGRPPRQPLAGPERDVGAPADRNAPQRDRLRRDRPLEPGPRAAAGYLGRDQRRALRRHAPVHPALARPRPLPLPAAAARDLPAHRAGDPPRGPQDQRRAAVGARGRHRVPARRDREAPPRHLLRVATSRRPRSCSSIPSRRIGNHLFVDPRPLIPIVVTWLFALAILGLENDIGFAMLLFTLFLALLWTSTGRVVYLVAGLALFAVGAVVAAHVFPQVHERVTVWLNPWPYAQTGRRAAHPRLVRDGSGRDPRHGRRARLGDLRGPEPHDRHDDRRDRPGARDGRASPRSSAASPSSSGPGCRSRSAPAPTSRGSARSGSPSSSASRPSSSWPACCGCSRSPASPCRSWPTAGSSLVANYVLIALLMRLSEEAESRPTAAPSRGRRWPRSRRRPPSHARASGRGGGPRTRIGAVTAQPQRDRDAVGRPAVEHLVAARSHEVELGEDRAAALTGQPHGHDVAPRVPRAPRRAGRGSSGRGADSSCEREGDRLGLGQADREVQAPKGGLLLQQVHDRARARELEAHVHDLEHREPPRGSGVARGRRTAVVERGLPRGRRGRRGPLLRPARPRARRRRPPRPRAPARRPGRRPAQWGRPRRRRPSRRAPRRSTVGDREHDADREEEADRRGPPVAHERERDARSPA